MLEILESGTTLKPDLIMWTSFESETYVFLYHPSWATEQSLLGSNYCESKCPFIGDTYRLCTSKVTSRVL